jgi:hypothetical protein
MSQTIAMPCANQRIRHARHIATAANAKSTAFGAQYNVAVMPSIAPESTLCPYNRMASAAAREEACRSHPRLATISTATIASRYVNGLTMAGRVIKGSNNYLYDQIGRRIASIGLYIAVDVVTCS